MFGARLRVVTNHRFSLALIVCGLFLVAFIFYSPRASALDDYVVSISVDSTSRTVRTTGGTVGELLKKAGVDIGKYDLVEPGLDSEIDSPVFNINIFRARPVTVSDEGNSYVVMSPYSSGRLIAENAGVKVYPEDKLSLNRVDNILEAGIVGEQLIIDRATPVEINLYGNPIKIRTHSRTVGELLDEKGIVPDKEDELSLDPSTVLEKGMVISVIRVGVEVVSEEETIKYKTETIWDDSLTLNTRVIEVPGVNGLRLATYEVEYHNGKEVNRQELKSVIAEETVTEIIRIGTKVVDSTDNVSLGQQMAEQKGWVGEQWVCLYELWQRESHWNHLAQNPYSTAFGIPQFLDGTWAGTGYPKSTDPATQIKAGFAYIENRYGSPCGAWDFFQINNWY